MIHLKWHDYRYFPYERDMALRELSAVLGVDPTSVDDDGVRLETTDDPAKATLLTYFASVQNGKGCFPTIQAHLESEQRSGKARQSTRYSVHGLHEYKGKFNPQIARAVLNVFGAGPGTRVLDPFCGSGTTLVECAHLGASGFGVDVNPMAVYVANAKLAALGTPASELRDKLGHIIRECGKKRTISTLDADREKYLLSWFDEPVFEIIETVRTVVLSEADKYAPFFLVLASNLLRDYSQQEPGDLRIRRRRSPMPEVPFLNAYEVACEKAIDKLAIAQEVVGTIKNDGQAQLLDSREGIPSDVPFDFALTSPPYAMALPYIDTQRLSLVWLDMCSPKGIGPLDAALVGSREIRRAESECLRKELLENQCDLPTEEAALCQTLQGGLTPEDGFRRQAVPSLLYRYFEAMRSNFRAVHKAVKPGGRYALIVGHNRTTIGGIRYDIDTPRHLGSLAAQVGWTVEEAVELQTYQRFGLHASNAITSETLLILKR